MKDQDLPQGHSASNASEGSHAETQKAQETKEKKQSFRESVVSLAFALFVVFMIRSSVFESFKIPSGSMIPTLAIGDYIFVNKFAYGFKVPFTDALLDEPVFIVKRDPPKRGDVVVFRFPRDESIYFIKRVIGLPGDVVELRDKVLFINGKQVPRDPMPEAKQKEVLEGEVLKDPQYTVAQPDFFVERLDAGEGKQAGHMMMLDSSNPGGRDFGPVTVPADSLFALGDNRDVSNDSRYWGFVPMKNVAGKAMAIWFSFWVVDLSEGQFYFHPSRIGSAIR
jgi:signal peptidase I